MDAIDSIQYMLEHPGQLRGLSTGYSKLDAMSSGLQGGEMFVIAARPSMGKTSLAMNIVEHIAVDCNTPCAVFSLEMSATMLVRRLLVSRARLSMQDLSRGLLSRAQQDALAKATRDLQKAQIFIDETPGLDIMEMRAKSRRLKKQHGIQMIMIDYLQLVTSQSRRAKDNRQIEIAEISAGIKGLAKELNVPIIVLAQLNRAVESRKGQRPVLSDLRESGSIEQDADMVGLLTRSDYAGAKMEVEDEEAAGHIGARFFTQTTTLDAVTKALKAAGWQITTSEMSYIPKEYPEVTDEQRDEITGFLQALDGHDDVHRVYAALK
jgi:replicative DNA helicase